MIEIENITKVYQMGETEVRALNGVSLKIDDGEWTAITGPSGSGKSTLMAILGCLDSPTSGTKYHLDGTDVAKMRDDQLAAVRNKKIGFGFQQFNLLARVNARRQVDLPLFYVGISGRKRRQMAEEALERVGLADRANHRTDELSGGQQQRVAIARALVNRPSLLLAVRASGRFMVVFAWTRAEGGPNGRRLGVTASRRIGNAVVRARAKRRLRELYRLDPGGFAGRDVDVVINARRGGGDAPWDELQRDYRRCVERLTERLAGA